MKFNYKQMLKVEVILKKGAETIIQCSNCLDTLLFIFIG